MKADFAQAPSAPEKGDVSASEWTERGSAAYRRMSVALFLVGFATFSLIYCVQPLLPDLVRDFAVSPPESSLALSLTTGFLAVAILCAGAVSEGLGRRGLMFFAMAGAAVLNILAAGAPTWPLLLAARAAEGVVLGGVPAVAMAYLAEEVHPDGLGSAMGLYVGGTALGGMFGRIGAGMAADVAGWRAAVAGIGVLALLAALAFGRLAPPSRNFTRRPGFDASYHVGAWSGHLRRPGLPLLFLIGFCAMGAFVTVYNYADFRLGAPPYDLTPTQISFFFLSYLFGVFSSSMAGALADRLGRRPVLIAGFALALAGVLLTLAQGLVIIALGIVLLTVGFFIAHSVASGWVGRLAPRDKGHASSLYLLAYYLGSSFMGSFGGWFWVRGGWPAVAAFAGALLLAGLACAGLVADRRTSRGAK